MPKANPKNIPQLREEARTRNDHTGERIVTKHRGQSLYEQNYDKIKWGVRSK